MPDTKLSALTETTTLGVDDEIYVNDSGTSKRITRANFEETLSIQLSQIEEGITATATELNHCDGVTSNIQDQLDAAANVLAEGYTASATGFMVAGFAGLVNSSTSETYHKVAEGYVPRDGTLYSSIYGSTSSADSPRVQVYVNGSSVGTSHTLTSTTPAEKTDASISVSAGDLIQLYARADNTSLAQIHGWALRSSTGELYSFTIQGQH